MDPQTYAASQQNDPSENWFDRCQKFVRTALGFQGGVAGGGSAREEYQYTLQRGDIRKDASPPPNVPVYFDTRGSAGHVALSAGGGYAWTTDMDGPGTVSLHKISEIAKWAGPYMGYGLSEGGNTLDAAEAGSGNPLTKPTSSGGQPWYGSWTNPLGGLLDQSKSGGMNIKGDLEKAGILGLFGFGAGASPLEAAGAETAGGAAAGRAASAGGAAAGAAEGSLVGGMATATGIIAAITALFSGHIKQWLARGGAAIAGALLILMVVYRMSGMNAVPV